MAIGGCYGGEAVLDTSDVFRVVGAGVCVADLAHLHQAHPQHNLTVNSTHPNSFRPLPTAANPPIALLTHHALIFNPNLKPVHPTWLQLDNVQVFPALTSPPKLLQKARPSTRKQTYRTHVDISNKCYVSCGHDIESCDGES